MKYLFSSLSVDFYFEWFFSSFLIILESLLTEGPLRAYLFPLHPFPHFLWLYFSFQFFSMGFLTPSLQWPQFHHLSSNHFFIVSILCLNCLLLEWFTLLKIPQSIHNQQCASPPFCLPGAPGISLLQTLLGAEGRTESSRCLILLPLVQCIYLADFTFPFSKAKHRDSFKMEEFFVDSNFFFLS